MSGWFRVPRPCEGFECGRTLGIGFVLLLSAMTAPGWGAGPSTLDLNDFEQTRFGSPDALPPNANEQFGSPVAIWGDWMVVGAVGDDQAESALHDSGAAYVYRREGGSWLFHQKLLPADSAQGDRFGRDVDIFERWIVVGAPEDDDNGPSSGSAYVFRRDDSNSWNEFQKLLAGDPAAAQGNKFGTAVAVDGAFPSENPDPVKIFTIVVGAPGHRGNAPFGVNAGAVYLFQSGDNEQGWVGGTAAISPAAPESWEDDRFGSSVDISGDGIVVGAIDDSVALAAGGTGRAGSAFFLQRRNLVGTWGFDHKFVATDAAVGDQFSISVAMDVDEGNDFIVVIGENVRDSAYVYQGNTNLWGEVTISPIDGTAFPERFGDTVAVDLPLLLVGSPDANPDVAPPGFGSSHGALYVYERVGTNAWAELGYLTPDVVDRTGFTGMGERIAISGMTFAATAPFFDYADGETVHTAQGQFYVFELPPLFADGFESGSTGNWSTTTP